jgi:transposase
MIMQYCKHDEDCKSLMTVPWVGLITAMTYKSTLDDPSRFEDLAIVGAYMGLTPKQYASGDINRQGSISKMGPKVGRTS